MSDRTINRRALRASLGTRSSRRQNTKARDKAKRKPSVRVRLVALIEAERQKRQGA